MPALPDTAARRDAASIEKLIDEGERPNIQDPNSSVPLHMAAFFRRHAAAQCCSAAAPM
jgi:ankyrin repeat protein